MSPPRRPCSWGPLDTDLNKGEASRAGPSVARILASLLASSWAGIRRLENLSQRKVTAQLGHFLESAGVRN